MFNISIIIPTRNRIHLLIDCIDSILSQSYLPKEIIIVDSSSNGNFSETIKNKFSDEKKPMLRYVSTSIANANFQRNLGISMTECDLVTFLDDDTILDQNYLSEINSFFSKYGTQGTGAVSGRILSKQTFKYESFKPFSISLLVSKIFLLWHYGDGKFQTSGIPTLIDPKINQLQEIEYIHGGSATLPRNILNEFSFDEKMPCWSVFEDDDLALRISKKYKMYWLPTAFLYHDSYLIKNNRYSKCKGFIINYNYLRKKYANVKYINSFSFYRAILGKILLELIFAMKNKNLSGIRGIFSGYSIILRNT